MKRYGLLWGGPGLAVVFWLFDSALHYYGYEERVNTIPTSSRRTSASVKILVKT